MLDLLYLTLSICAVVLTAVIVRRISNERGPLITISNSRTTIINRHPKEEDLNK